jgi:hypothetical protein
VSQDAFASAVRADGIFGAVFERDDDTAYFYLLDMGGRDGQKIIGAFNATNCAPPRRTEVSVRWSLDGGLAGLFAGKNLLAVFEVDSDSDAPKHGRVASQSDVGRFTWPNAC